MWRQNRESPLGGPESQSPVVLIGPPSPLGMMVLEIGALVGVPIEAYDGVEDLPGIPSLILTLPDVRLPRAMPHDVAACLRASVGEADDAADFAIPQQAHLLAQLLAQLLADPRFHSVDGTEHGGPGGRPCLLVCGCHGGSGTSHTAQQFAKAQGAVVLDASGHPPPIPVDDPLTWEFIDATDPPLPTDLLAGLSRSGGVRCLRAFPGNTVDLSDPRVLAVAKRTPVPSVVDGGVWGSGVDRFMGRLAAAGHGVRLVLTAREDDVGARTLVGVLAAASAVGIPQMVLARGRTLEALQLVAEEWRLPVYRFPKPGGKRWRALWQEIWEE